MPLIVNNKEVKKIIHDDSGLEVLEMKDSSGKLLHKRVNLEFRIDEFRPYTETIDTWGTIMDVPDDPILEDMPTIYLVGWSYDGVNALPEPIRVPIEDSTLYAIWSDALVNIFNLDIGTRVRLNSKSTNAVVIGSSVTLEPNFKKGVDASSGNINKYINTDLTFKYTSSNEVKFSNSFSVKSYLLLGEDFSVGSLDSGISMVSFLDTQQGTFNTFNESMAITLDKFTKGKDVSYSGSFDIESNNNLMYDSRMGISLNEVIRSNPLTMLRGEDFSISLDNLNTGIESELDVVSGDGYNLSLVTGLSIDEFIRGEDVNYSGNFNITSTDNLLYDSRMGISLNEVLKSNPIVFQKGSNYYVNLNSSMSADMNLDTYLQNGKGFNITARPNVSNLNSSVDDRLTNTPTIMYVICDNQGRVQVGLRNNDSSPVTMYLKTLSTFYSVGTQVQPGATLIYTVLTGHSGNYYYNNWMARAKASDKSMSRETAPVSGSVSCPVPQLKWVYVPNHSGFGIPSFDNPEGKACSIEGSYTSYEDTNGTKWFRCTKV